MPVESDEGQDPEDFPRRLDRVFHRIDPGLDPFELEEPPEDARRHDPVDGFERFAGPLVEPLGGDHLGQALGNPGDNVLVLRLDQDADRGIKRELLGASCDDVITSPFQTVLLIDRELDAREQADPVAMEQLELDQSRFRAGTAASTRRW
jgi:hypothetical protein